MLADGRIAVSHSAESNGNRLWGEDVFADILDLRVTGFSVAGTASVDRFLGTAFSDTFSNVSSGDTITGGNGDDTVVFTGATARIVDLANPDAFPESAFVLSSIENLTDSADNDRINGFEVGSDKLLLQADAFGDLSTVALSTRLTINASATVAANASAQLIFDNSGAGAGRLFFDADGNGAGAAVLLATLDFSSVGGLAAFSASDFVFI